MLLEFAADPFTGGRQTFAKLCAAVKIAICFKNRFCGGFSKKADERKIYNTSPSTTVGVINHSRQNQQSLSKNNKNPTAVYVHDV